MSRTKLQVGIVLESIRIPAWAHRMLTIICESDYAEISLVVNLNPIVSLDQGRDQSVIKKMLLAVQRKLVGKPGFVENALVSTSATDLLAGIPTVSAISQQGEAGTRIDVGSLNEIQNFDLDVLIQVGSSAVSHESLAAVQYGIWSIEVGANVIGSRVLPGYWEVMESRPETRSVLRIRTVDHDQGRFAVQSFSSTKVMSIEDNASLAFWKSLHFVPRKLRELHCDGGTKFISMLRDESTYPIENVDRYSHTPSDWHLAKLLLLKMFQKIVRKWRDLFYIRQWFLLFYFGEDESRDFGRFKRLLPPKDRFWADPFVVCRDGKYYVFFEECLLSEGRGFISVLELGNSGVIDGPVPVLENQYHLSYPFLLEIDDELYMIPETAQNRTVELYKCTEFPFKWQFQKNLMVDCSIVDATLLEWNGRWWMFGNSVVDANASTWDELHLFYSNSPFSDNWTAHPRNPVVSDVRSSRPAGRIVVRGGRIYRPSQDSSRHYGYGLNICEVTILTETDYEEKIVSKIEPDWADDIISTHTINHEHGLTVIDGQRWRRK